MDVSCQREAVEYRETGTCRQKLVRTVVSLLAIGALPFAVLAISGPELFRWVLGSNWGLAGEIAQALSPVFLLRLIVAPVSHTLLFTGHQRMELIVNLGSLLLVAAMIGIAIVSEGAPFRIIATYAVGVCGLYLLYLTFAF